MVMRPGTYQTNFNAGELAPELHGNWGFKGYFAGARAMENVSPIPQGGFELLPRTQFIEDLGPVAGFGTARLQAFTYSLTDAYVISFEPGSARIFKEVSQVAILALPYASADVGILRTAQRFETMLIWHSAYPPQRLLRGGDDLTWSTSAITWSNMPQVQYSGIYVNTDEIWDVRIQWTSGTTVQGQSFNLTVDGEATTTITIPTATGGGAPDWTATATAMLAALSNITEIVPGMAVAVAASGSLYQEFTVTFSGGTNSGSNFQLSGTFPLITTMALTTARTTKGLLGGENVMSVARGWPRCGTFYQDRLLQAGFAAKPDAWLASRTSEYFDLNTRLTADSGAMLINFDADGSETLIHLIQSAYLGFFTTEGFYHLQDRALKVSAAPNLVKSPQAEGASARVAPVIQESAILYVNRTETILYMATYNAYLTTFDMTPLSIDASHLFSGRDGNGIPIAYGIAGMVLQKAHVKTDPQRLFLWRDDGVLIIVNLIRNQDVQPFVRWTTDGLVRSVVVDGSNQVYLLVDRLVGGVWHRFYEKFVDGTLLDAAISFTFGTPTSVVTGLGEHEGATVWAEVDGYIDGPFTVVSGTITLTYPGLAITVGRWTPPVMTTLPLARDVGNRTVLKRPCRVHTVQVDVIGTTSIAIGANDQPATDVTIARTTDPVDQPTPAYTGELIATGLDGFSEDGCVTISQVRPGRLQVRNVTIQART